MSDFQPGSAPPPPEGYGGPPQAVGPKPASIKNAINIIWAYIALSVITTALSFVYLDQLIDDAMASQPANSSVTEDSIRTFTIAILLIILLIVVGLSALLAVFLGKGKNWARIVLTILTGISLVFGLLSLVGGGPAALLVAQIISLLLAAALIFFLWKKESSQ